MAAEGFKTSPLIGVGADNYFSNYKTLRERYSAAHPDNPMLEVIAETIPERAHNEYLQILCELGLVGGLFFAWLMAGVGYMFVAALRKRASLTTLGALAGIGAFLVSSFASSYSFRVPANGICFFFLIAVAAREVFAPGERDEVSVKRPLLVFAGVGVALAMLVFSSVRALSIYYFSNAQLCEDKELAAAEIDKAIALDPQEPMFRFYRGQQLYFSGEYDEAIPELRFAVDHGIGTSPAYFNLLAAEMLAGKDDESRRTFDEALRVYPRSVFLRTAYAAFLKRQGDDAGAEIEYSHAYAIDPNQARSWRLAHEKGLDRLAQTAGSDPNYLPVAELIPVDGPLALVNFQRR
jgi:tetratricopeptide (TPR) repeat protein